MKPEEVYQPGIQEVDDSMSAIHETVNSEYKYGFVTEIEADEAPKGLDESTVRFISAKKNEPEWMLEWRLKAFHQWQKNGRAALGQFALSKN